VASKGRKVGRRLNPDFAFERQQQIRALHQLGEGRRIRGKFSKREH
jgi:hypothetical protein